MKKFVIIIFFLFFGCEKEDIQIPQIKQSINVVEDTISKPIKKMKKLKNGKKRRNYNL